uniref:Uncharacterized protein n=1 Tax=Haptolina brevifila TaxID=156173 RepID=A0A7S2FZM0_9EUKA
MDGSRATEALARGEGYGGGGYGDEDNDSSTFKRHASYSARVEEEQRAFWGGPRASHPLPSHRYGHGGRPPRAYGDTYGDVYAEGRACGDGYGYACGDAYGHAYGVGDAYAACASDACASDACAHASRFGGSRSRSPHRAATPDGCSDGYSDNYPYRSRDRLGGAGGGGAMGAGYRLPGDRVLGDRLGATGAMRHGGKGGSEYRGQGAGPSHYAGGRGVGTGGVGGRYDSASAPRRMQEPWDASMPSETAGEEMRRDMSHEAAVSHEAAEILSSQFFTGNRRSSQATSFSTSGRPETSSPVGLRPSSPEGDVSGNPAKGDTAA